MARRSEEETPMVDRDGNARHSRFGTVVMLTLILKAEESFAGDAAGLNAVAPGIFPNPVVAEAVRLAAIKLSNPACREVFSDFHDAAGHTLQQNLDLLERSGIGYLQWTLFYEGYGKSVCDSRKILASTTPGSRVVFVCTPQFAVVQHRDPGLAAVLIIHEELHSLGLGENPPQSRVITAQVIARCGK